MTDNPKKLTDDDIEEIAGQEAETVFPYDDVIVIKDNEHKLKQQILRNQEIVERLKEFLSDPLNDPESHGIVFHNPEYANFLQEVLDG